MSKSPNLKSKSKKICYNDPCFTASRITLLSRQWVGGATVGLCHLYLSKAFEMNHHTQLITLMKRQVSVHINVLEMIEQWFDLSCTFIKWGSLAYRPSSSRPSAWGKAMPCHHIFYLFQSWNDRSLVVILYRHATVLLYLRRIQCYCTAMSPCYELCYISMNIKRPDLDNSCQCKQ